MVKNKKKIMFGHGGLVAPAPTNYFSVRSLLCRISWRSSLVESCNPPEDGLL